MRGRFVPGRAAADVAVNGGGFDIETGALTLTDNSPETPDVVVDLSELKFPMTWQNLVAHWDAEPELIGAISSGAVFSYMLGGTTRYRHVPDPYDATQDAFYSDWDGSALSGLIVARGGT
jgi:hypothetical protein